MATKSMGEQLLDKAWELREEYAATLERRAANRRSLRDLRVQGLLSEAEAAQVDELYPERQRGEGETEPQAQAA